MTVNILLIRDQKDAGLEGTREPGQEGKRSSEAYHHSHPDGDVHGTRCRGNRRPPSRREHDVLQVGNIVTNEPVGLQLVLCLGQC